jgi:hypothetical protein
MTDLGEVMFLPNQFAEEIKNDHGFSFTTAFEKVCDSPDRGHWFLQVANAQLVFRIFMPGSLVLRLPSLAALRTGSYS